MSVRDSIGKAFRNLVSLFDLSDSSVLGLLKAYTGLVYVFLYGPVLVVMILSFTESQVPSFPMEGFTLEWYALLFPPEPYDQDMFQGLIESIKLGVITAIGSGIIGTMGALGMVRNEFDGRLLTGDNLRLLFTIPIVTPWIVTAIAVLVFYSLIGINGTYISLILGHILITLPFTLLIIASQLYGFDRSIEEAAKNLGATKFRTFREITLPIIAPGIIGGMLFAFTLSFDNFTQTFFWAQNTQTLPIVIFSTIRRGMNPSVNAISTIIIFFSLAIAIVAERLTGRVQE